MFTRPLAKGSVPLCPLTTHSCSLATNSIGWEEILSPHCFSPSGVIPLSHSHCSLKWNKYLILSVHWAFCHTWAVFRTLGSIGIRSPSQSYTISHSTSSVLEPVVPLAHSFLAQCQATKPTSCRKKGSVIWEEKKTELGTRRADF